MDRDNGQRPSVVQTNAGGRALGSYVEAAPDAIEAKVSVAPTIPAHSRHRAHTLVYGDARAGAALAQFPTRKSPRASRCRRNR